MDYMEDSAHYDCIGLSMHPRLLGVAVLQTYSAYEDNACLLASFDARLPTPIEDSSAAVQHTLMRLGGLIFKRHRPGVFVRGCLDSSFKRGSLLEHIPSIHVQDSQQSFNPIFHTKIVTESKY